MNFFSAVRSMLMSFVVVLFPYIGQLTVVVYFLVLTAYISSYEGEASYTVPTNSSDSAQQNADGGDSCTPTITYENVTNLNGGSYVTVASVRIFFFTIRASNILVILKRSWCF